MDTILVTGGAGFIGSNFVRAALARIASRVVVLDKLTYAGSLLNLEEVARDPRYAFVRGDVADRALVRRVMQEYRPQWVVHFAAESHVDRSIDDPSPVVTTNLVGTFELLEASRRLVAGLDPAARARFRFLQVSTDEVYGSLGETGLFHETTAYAPNSPYSATKAGADHLAQAWARTYGLPVLITNCSQQLWPAAVPGEADPAGDPERAGGEGPADLRRRRQRPRLAVRRRPLRGDPRRARARPPGTELQRRRRQRTHQPAGGGPDLRGARRSGPGGRERGAGGSREAQLQRTEDLRRRPPGARPPLRDRRRQDPAPSWAWRPRHASRRGWPRPCAGTLPTARGAQGSRPASTGASGWGSRRTRGTAR